MTLTTRVRALLQRRRAHRELKDELTFHLEMETEANVARGMVPATARQAALASFGGVVQATELVHEVRTMTIESVWHDVRQAAGRSLRIAGSRLRLPGCWHSRQGSPRRCSPS